MPAPVEDSDFGDFEAGAPEAPAAEATPIYEPLAGDDADAIAAAAATAAAGAAGVPGSDPTLIATPVPYTKWYNLSERYTLMDFWAEGFIITAFALLMVLYTWGASTNRSRARKWFKLNSPVLASEFALVGFKNIVVSTDSPTVVDEATDLRERSPFEFATYATGRTNVAFVDVQLSYIKRFNPINTIVEMGLATFFESFPMPEDTVKASLYPFDGREGNLVPEIPGTSELALAKKNEKSTYDNFVFALVHKDKMKKLRDERYDLSITFTKDHPKLPVWVTTMSESAEITDAIMTEELIKAVDMAGDNFEYLIITDQPIEKPTTIEECKSTKRITIKYRIPSSDSDLESLLPLFKAFLRFPDHLTQAANFRPNVTAKLRALRDHQVKELKKAAEDEKAEERALDRDRARKEKREKELNALDAKAQKKYLEKEKELEMKRAMRKGAVKR